MEAFDIIIIGGGPAGYTAALYGARAGRSVLLLEKLAPGGQMGTTDLIDNYPGFPQGVKGFQLAMDMKAGAERFGAQTKLEAVTALELAGDVKTVHTKKDGYEARAVILATGAQPRELGLPQERALRGRGVSYCATCDGMFYRGKDVAIIGGGNTAVADALYLSKLCGRVYLIHRRDKLRAPDSQRVLLEQAGNVEFLWNSRAEELLYAERLTGLKTVRVDTGESRTLDCAGVFVAVGQVPETSLLAGQVELDEAGYVVAGENCQTNLPGGVAAGDLRQKPLRQIITAAADGAVAAQMAEEFLQRERT